MTRFTVLMLAVALGLSGCKTVNGRDKLIVTSPTNSPTKKDSVTCIKPPPEYLATYGDISGAAITQKLGEIAKANLTASEKVQKLRDTLPNVQSYEILDYRLCIMYANHILDRSAYTNMIQEVLPHLFATQAPKSTMPGIQASASCNYPISGKRGWQMARDYTDSSAWLGGGRDPTWWCNQVANSFLKANSIGSDNDVKYLSSSEESHKDFWGHVTYKYHCTVRIYWEPCATGTQ